MSRWLLATAMSRLSLPHPWSCESSPPLSLDIQRALGSSQRLRWKASASNFTREVTCPSATLTTRWLLGFFGFQHKNDIYVSPDPPTWPYWGSWMLPSSEEGDGLFGGLELLAPFNSGTDGFCNDLQDLIMVPDVLHCTLEQQPWICSRAPHLECSRHNGV